MTTSYERTMRYERMSEHQALAIQRAANGPGMGGLKLDFTNERHEVTMTTFTLSSRASDVYMTDHQREAIRERANRAGVCGIARMELSFAPFDLPAGYILIREWTTGVCETPFEIGIDANGRGSS